jgi:hypothetical protein
MTKDNLLKRFWNSSYKNKLLLTEAIAMTILHLTYYSMITVVAIFWGLVIYQAKEIRHKYPNKSWLLLFALISLGLESYWSYFGIAKILFMILMFIPETKWNHFVRKNK